MEDTARSLAGAGDAERAETLARFAVLRPHLEDGVPLTRAAREADVPFRTAQRWLARYRQGGLAELLERPRSDRGHSHGLPPELERLIEGLALRRPAPTVASIHRRASEVAVREGWPEPHYRQVYRLVRHLDPALVALAQEGDKGYRQAYDLLHRREASRPNEIWQADHTELDIRVIDERGQSARPWLTVILDDYSRAVPGYYLALSAPSSTGTALALQQAIWRKGDAKWQVCGIPDTFYTDHGPDFTSKRMEQVAVDIEMGLVYSEPGQPRGRGKIERFFGTVNRMLLLDLPGYKPAGSGPVEPVLTLAALEARFRSWLIDTYHRRIHGETHQTPAEHWEAGGFLPRLPESLERLDLLLLTVPDSRRVRRDGIRFHGYRYMDATLAAYVGENVIIRYDPRDLAEIRVYHEGAFLCRAVCAELAGATVSLQEIVSARNRRRRELQTELRDRQAAVEELLALRRREPPPVELEPELPRPAKPRLKRYIHE
ncbi:MAG: DDE-type integrase/transposase/recombinase [Chloroflexia bacterium]|nr:DDE-type integrase/transposase/recombinase [Chloroflexia bacterium]